MELYKRDNQIRTKERVRKCTVLKRDVKLRVEHLTKLYTLALDLNDFALIQLNIKRIHVL